MEALTTAIFVMVLKCASGVSAPLLALPLAWAGYGKATDLPEISSTIVAGMCLIPQQARRSAPCCCFAGEHSPVHPQTYWLQPRGRITTDSVVSVA